MSSHPHQYFVYGVAVLDEERANELNDDEDVDLYGFGEENGVAYEFGGADYVQGLVVGFKFPRSDSQYDTGDYGDYQVAPFDPLKLAEWVAKAKGRLTPALVAKIQQFLGVTTEPALYTISNYG